MTAWVRFWEVTYILYNKGVRLWEVTYILYNKGKGPRPSSDSRQGKSFSH